LFGLPPEAEVNYDLFLRGLHPDDRRRVHETVQALLDSGGHARFSVQYRTIGLQDGVLRWLAAEGRAYFDANGRAVRFIGTVHDITEGKRLGAAVRSREEQFRTLVEQSPLSIQIVSPEGRTLQVNRAWEELWGLRLEDLAGYDMLEDRQLEELGIMPYIRRAFAGEAVSIPPVRYDRRRTLPHAVGEEEDPVRWVRAYAYPVHDAAGMIHGVVLIHEDVTARKRLEDELRDRVAELAEAARHKDQFLSMLAHELRNPIAALANALQVMELSAPATPAYTRARAAAHRQVRHQRRLVDDLLDVSRIDRGKVQIRIEPLDWAQLVRDTIEDHRPSLEQAELSVRTELPQTPVWVDGDSTRLAQVLSNLLDNAVKFTPAGGTVTVRFSVDPGLPAGEADCGANGAAPSGSGTARLEVSDTGIGLDPSLAPYLFEPFRQADSTLDRSRGGLGLGLALVRGLVELHGGTVTASSAGPGRGSTFAVCLPLSIGGSPHPGANGAAPPARAPVKELMIPGLASHPIPEASSSPATGSRLPSTALRGSSWSDAPRKPWCSATSAFPGWMATPWHASCAVIPRPSVRRWSP
jgi:PAS domain S-box-containing protein